MPDDVAHYPRYRFPPAIISHAVWLYYRFTLSFRDVEDLLAQRGIAVSYESIRHWCETFGVAYARRLRRRSGPVGDTWHLDELFVTIRGRCQYLWRAVDQDGEVIDILLQPRRGVGARIETDRYDPNHRYFTGRWRTSLAGPVRSSRSGCCRRAALLPFAHQVSWLEDRRR